MNPRLVALSGPLAGTSFPLDGTLRLGRHSSNDVQLPDPAVSRFHCEIGLEDEAFVLHDLDSRLGTFVNGIPVARGPLAAGDLVTLGDTLFRFAVGADDEPASPPPLAAFFDDSTVMAATTLERPVEAAVSAPALRALLDLARDLHTLRGVETLARRILAAALDLAPAERAALYLLGPDGELGVPFAAGRHGPLPPFPVSRTLARRILDEKSALVARDVLLTPGVGDLPSVLSARLCSLAGLALVAPGHTVGLLYLDTGRAEAALGEEHLEPLGALAGTAAVALLNALHLEWLDGEAGRLREALAADGEMVGESPRLREALRLLKRAAATSSTVLLRGESGTGKELAARALHRDSPRAERPFVAVNCAVLSEELLASELFGHERGAFTGAVARRLGAFEAAHTGTLFLDEVGELPPPLQAKLLRALQEREIVRLGSTQPVRIDARVVAATHRDLESEVAAGTFRRDLYYRLNVVAIPLPPLRERREDVQLLASHFAARLSRRLGRPLAGFTREARLCLALYDWPGNVRELSNAIERALVLGDGEQIRPEDLPESILEAVGGARGATAPEAPLPAYHAAVQAHKERLILEALAASEGSVTRAAQALGLHPNYLHRLIKNLGLRATLTGIAGD